MRSHKFCVFLFVSLVLNLHRTFLFFGFLEHFAAEIRGKGRAQTHLRMSSRSSSGSSTGLLASWNATQSSLSAATGSVVIGERAFLPPNTSAKKELIED
jgi:hypothetical protein